MALDRRPKRQDARLAMQAAEAAAEWKLPLEVFCSLRAGYIQQALTGARQQFCEKAAPSLSERALKEGPNKIATILMAASKGCVLPHQFEAAIKKIEDEAFRLAPKNNDGFNKAAEKAEHHVAAASGLKAAYDKLFKQHHPSSPDRLDPGAVAVDLPNIRALVKKLQPRTT